ncbi:FUSC family protein [Frigoribacterium sp. CFBP9039]|uniref:FUSC family protein n=1 Tax=Frigoribacterium sp. CFBP9029 TaxID=3096541 RepID=UPI002A6A6FA4|nr:FUSC family protein [Frigoribacterium sp. CFBP9039]MDY0946467.1 FUSC family protein [Frigoribacterium sp. CFBP9039]
MGVASRIRQSKRTPLLQVVKTSAAVIAAWFVSVALLQQPLPIFAAIAALLVVLPSVNQSFVRGLERSVGVIAGVLIAFAAGLVFGDATWIVLVIVVVSLLVAWAFRLTPSSANQVPISAMLVLAIGAQTPDYALDRVLETIIGAAIALAVNALIVPPVLLAPAHLAVGRLARDIASVLDETAAVLSEPVDAARLRAGLDDARALRAAQARASSAVTAGVESLQLNPRASRNRSVLEADGALLDRLTVLVNRVVGMVRSVHDNYDPGLADDPVVQSIAEDLRRAAHDVRILARTTEEARPADTGRPASSTPSPDDTPALTSPVQVLRPDPDNWVLVGSLLEDLRRVREEIIG